jgi:formate dehydrogenase major subunit
MELNRRDFLKASGAGVGGVFLFGALNPEVVLARSAKVPPLRKMVGEKSTICPYDASGCGFLVAAVDGKVVNIEGDPDHPINRGSGCAKGASMRQLSADNPWRLSTVLYRPPGGAEWQEKSWDWTVERIAARIKETRDAGWVTTDEDGYRVNRTDAIASVGGAALDNEECYLLVKMLRSLGLVYVEHQARI